MSSLSHAHMHVPHSCYRALKYTTLCPLSLSHTHMHVPNSGYRALRAFYGGRMQQGRGRSRGLRYLGLRICVAHHHWYVVTCLVFVVVLVVVFVFILVFAVFLCISPV